MKKLLIILSILCLSSCCRSDLIGTIRFPVSDLSVNPYEGNEVINFIDDSNRRITYKGGGRIIHESEAETCKGGCCDFYLVESHENTYLKSSYMESDLQLIIHNNFSATTATKKKSSIHFVWNYYEIEPYVTSTSFAMFPIDSMQIEVDKLSMFRDSLMLRNQMFYQVYTFPGNCPYPDRLHGDTLFYTIEKGIVGLRLSDGNLWVIEP